MRFITVIVFCSPVTVAVMAMAQGSSPNSVGQVNCAAPAPQMTVRDGDWSGWGRDSENSRFQPLPGLSIPDVPKLKLKWAFGFPNQSTAGSQPSIAGGRVFVGTSTGQVYALSSSSGCQYWTYRAGAGVRSAISIGKTSSGTWAVFFGDSQAWVYSLNAVTGELLWKRKVEQHPAAQITGSPVLVNGRLYVPMSSREETWAHDQKYSCCTFRGSLSALDAATGEKIWQGYSITEPAKAYSISRGGVELVGPAGAAIWSAPTIDLNRGRAYVATGNSYTGVDVSTSDAIVAYDLDTGKLAWSIQLHARDNFIVGCPFHPNCPDPHGSDFDFGASPVLRTLDNGRQILVAAQKSGEVYGLDPADRGSIVWQTRVGRGGVLGGVMWGLAAADLAYVAVADRLLGRAGDAGLYALDLATGEKKWAAPAPMASGNPAQSAAVTAMPGVIFSGAVNGHFRAYAGNDGKVIWDFDTNRAFETVNGVAANGGSIDGPGPVIVAGWVYTNSGYEPGGGEGGNVLLAFSVDGR